MQRSDYQRGVWYTLDEEYVRVCLRDSEASRPVFKQVIRLWEGLRDLGLMLQVQRSKVSNNSMYVQVSDGLRRSRSIRLSNHRKQAVNQNNHNDFDIWPIMGHDLLSKEVDDCVDRIKRFFLLNQTKEDSVPMLDQPAAPLAALTAPIPRGELGAALSRIADLFESAMEENRTLRAQLQAIENPLQRLLGMVGYTRGPEAPSIHGPVAGATEAAPQTASAVDVRAESSDDTDRWVGSKEYLGRLLPGAEDKEYRAFRQWVSKRGLQLREGRTSVGSRMFLYRESDLEVLFKEFVKSYQPRNR